MARQSKKSEIKTEYIVKYGIDKEELARYLLIARGDRTMKDFVHICSNTLEKWKEEGLLDPSVKAGISESTFSRIAKGARYGEEGIKRPLSEAVMKAIYENASDPNKIELSLFMASNGMVKVDEKGEVVDDPLDNGGRTLRGIRLSKAREKRKEDVISIIEEEYSIRGRSIRDFTSGEYKDPYLVQVKSAFPEAMPESTNGFRWKSGLFAIHVEDEETPLIHNYIMDYELLFNDEEEHRVRNVRFIKNDLIDDHSKLFLRDLWEPEDFKEVMHTIIFASEDRYAAFVDLFKDLHVNNYFSAILINLEERYIKKEVGLTRFDGKKVPLITPIQIKKKKKTVTDYSDFMEEAVVKRKPN